MSSVLDEQIILLVSSNSFKMEPEMRKFSGGGYRSTKDKDQQESVAHGKENCCKRR